MLPDSLRDVAARRIKIEFDARTSVFREEVQSVMEAMSARGALRSGMTQKRITDLIRAELEIRAMLAWQTLGRVLTGQSLAVDAGTIAEIKRFIADVVSAGCNDLREQLASTANLVGNQPRPFDDFYQRAIDKVESEIDIAMLSTRSGATSAGPTTINIYQPYGIVQTGAGSSATFSVTADNKTVVLNALQAVETALEGPGIEETDRRQAREIIQDARQELDRDKPNTLRIRGALSALGSTIQTMGSAAAAYQLLKGAAAFFGVQLP